LVLLAILDQTTIKMHGFALELTVFLVNPGISDATVLSDGQQFLLGQHLIHQGALGKNILHILFQATVPNLGKTELSLHHPKHMLNPRTGF